MLAVFELGVALPYRAAVLTGRVPYLGAEKSAAVSANNTRSKNAVPTVSVSDGFAPHKFGLYQFELQRVYDRLMALFYVILRHLALVCFHLFRQEIDREFLLQ